MGRLVRILVVGLVQITLVGCAARYAAPRETATPTPAVSDPVVIVSGHEGIIAGLVFEPDPNHLISAAWDRKILVWGVSTQRKIARFEGHNGYVVGLAISPDGRVLASGSQDGTVRLWDVATQAGMFAL